MDSLAESPRDKVQQLKDDLTEYSYEIPTRDGDSERQEFDGGELYEEIGLPRGHDDEQTVYVNEDNHVTGRAESPHVEDKVDHLKEDIVEQKVEEIVQEIQEREEQVEELYEELLEQRREEEVDELVEKHQEKEVEEKKGEIEEAISQLDDKPESKKEEKRVEIKDTVSQQDGNQESKKEDKKLKLTLPPAFKDAGENPGIEIWRIENMEPVRQDTKEAGIFYKGDAYIVLATFEQPGLSKLFYNIHFWLGENCSQDESGSAAIHSVELDDGKFGGAAVQHREVQGHESKQFLGYFKKGIRYLEDGVKSGFREAKPDEFSKRLFQVKGRKNVRVVQVECKCGSLNQGDTFVLDNGRQLYVWIGPKSDKKEKLGGVELAKRIRDEERGGRAHIHVIDKDWDKDEDFFKALGSKDKAIRAADNTPDDDIVRKVDQEIILYKVQEDKMKPKGAVVTEEAGRPFKHSALQSQNCYVLDSGTSGIYVWTGKNTSTAFRQIVWKATNDFLDTRGYPHWVTVTRVMEGAETSLFTQYFSNWPVTIVQTPSGNVAKSDYSGVKGVDVSALHRQDTVEENMVDDGSGKKQVWRIKNFDLEPVKEEAYGVFFGGDSYVIQYEYQLNRKTCYIIYFWQGKSSTQDEQASAAAHAVKLDDKLGGQAVQIRVVMNKEPKHFMKIFGGKIVIFQGGHSSGFQSMESFEGYNSESTYMFHIKGTVPEETRAIQVTARGSSLNRNDVFIIHSPKKAYIWVGQEASEQEKEMAIFMLKDLAPKKTQYTIVKEGEEDNSFWNSIGGEESYYKGPSKTSSNSRISPRLFKCSQSSGRFTVEEIASYDQSDLDEDDVMLLDAYDEIFLWIGKNATDFEKKEAVRTAELYLGSEPTTRSKDNTLIICVRQGFEPTQFTGHFLAWDTRLWSDGKSFDDIAAEIGKENMGVNLVVEEKKKFDQFYPIEVLRRTPVPEYVDVTMKEMYLSDKDFKTVFGMRKDQWEKFPAWKKTQRKKDLGLF